MISRLGIVLILIYIILFVYACLSKKLTKFRLNTLIGCVVISLFINVGNFFLNVTFTEIASVICIATGIITMPNSVNSLLKMKVKVFLWFTLLITVMLLGLLNVSINSDMPMVLAMDTNMDQAYYGLQAVSQAEFSIYNRIAFMDLLLFVLVLYIYKNELSDANIIDIFIKGIRKAFHVFLILVLIEFVINNIISPVMIRDIVISIMGTLDTSKTFYPEARFGYYGITMFFSEQSYISIMLIYYAIVWVKGIKNVKELLFYVLSIAVLFMSGCSTGILIIPFALALFIRETITGKSRSWIKLLKWLFVTTIAAGGVYIVASNPIYFIDIFSSTMLKINALINGGLYTDNAIMASGATRNYANEIAYEAFKKSPLFGVGIGGTRGYGVISGLLATFGVLGIITFLGYLNSIIKLSAKGKIVLLAIILVYLSIVLSVWYVYMLAFIPLYVLFNKEYKCQRLHDE